MANRWGGSQAGAIPRVKSAGAGRYLSTPGFYNNARAGANQAMRAAPFWVDQTLSIDRIGCRVNLNGDGAAVARLGIYQSDTSGLPSALLLDAGTADATTGTVKEITVAQTLTPGKYWFAAAGYGYTATPPELAIDEPYVPHIVLLSSSDVYSGSAYGFLHSAAVTGALPATFLPTTMTKPFRMFVRCA